MTVHKIRTALPLKYESANRAAAERRLAEVRKQDPKAKLLTVPSAR